ncbi:MAG: anti-sigma factor family protein [Gemmatimonadales bacterium]
MKDQWTDRLSEYLDGELGTPERTTLEAHLAGCAACAATLDELRRVMTRARALDDRPPAEDLWPAIAEQIGVSSGAHRVVSLEQRRAGRRFTFTLPQLVAASVALALLSGGAGWLLVRERTARRTTTVATETPTPTPLMMNAGTYAVNPRYAAAVADLERALEQRRGRLDTVTVRVIEKNLGIIDRAIRNAQSALAADPGNSYLNLHLAEQMRRKVELLRRATTLASTQS